MSEPRIDSLHDPFEDQLSAARYKAERDAAMQELQAMREHDRALWMECHAARECLTCEEEKAERLGRIVWRLQNRLARAHRRERALRKGMREWREKVMGAPVRTVSAYDMLPEEDLRALRWVREQGGLDVVKTHSELFQQLKGERDELRELARDYEKRLMPEGMEDMIASYPRFEDGTPALPGMEAVANSGQRSGEAFTIKKVWLENGTWHLRDNTSDCHYWHFKHKNPVVKRPAPKVLDADGAEIRVGDTVWLVDGGGPYTVKTTSGRLGTVEFEADEWTAAKQCAITHRAPVLAADGLPLREGETVWGTKGGSYHLTSVHDGKVFARHVGGSFGAEVESAGGEGLYRLRADQLTHERPDTWERLDDDAGKNPFDYCKDVGHRLDTCENSEAYKARDLVRRAKALAGVSE